MITKTPAPTGVVIAVENGGAKGARVTVELDALNTREIHGEHGVERHLQETIHVSEAQLGWLGGSDMLLAHRVRLSDLREVPHA